MNQKWTRAICTVLTSALVFTGPAVEGTTFSGYINSGLEKVYAKTQKQKDAEKKKSQAEKDLKDKKNEINGLKDQQQTTADDIKNKSAKLDEILAAQKKLQTDITNKQAEIEQNQKDLAAAQEKQQEQYDAMKKRIQFMYENSAEDNIWTAIIESNGITDMLNRIEYVSDVYDSDRALMDSYQAAVEQVKEIGTKLDNDMNELTAMQDDYEKQQADVEAAIVALENQKEQYASQIAQAQQQADNYQNIITAQGKIIQEQEAAAAANVVVEGHIKLDTGMTRVGFQTDDADFDQSLKDIIEVSKMPNVKITGIFTHHAVADSYTGDNPDFTRMQFARFDKMVTALQDAGVHVGLRHCANSATTIAYPERHIDMCRSGIITYGMLPSSECEGMIDLKPLMTVKSTIGLVKHVPAGSQLSYGRTYTAETDRRIATIPIGYADGYNRALSNKAKMIVHGKYAPVVGRVCMDQLMIDVTDIPEAKMGDEVIVVGTDGDKHFTFDDMAAILGTINYELPCVLTKRVPRVYKENGEIVGIVDHVLHQYR